MNDNQRKARSALFSLKEAVLDVLYEARNGNRLQPKEISKRLGIKRFESSEHPYGFVRSVLFLLKDENHVDHVKDVGWAIKEETAALFESTGTENDNISDSN